jgi:hypothetical protein
METRRWSWNLADMQLGHFTDLILLDAKCVLFGRWKNATFGLFGCLVARSRPFPKTEDWKSNPSELLLIGKSNPDGSS